VSQPVSLIAISDISHSVTVESEYFSVLDANFARLDYSERPELQKGTIDFDVSESTNYWASNPPLHLSSADVLSDPSLSDVARKPQMMQYVFALDISHTSVHSGFLTSVCVALRTILFGRPSEDESEAMRACLPPGCKVALVTFDDVLHFYDLSVRSVPV
jgi:protein transport protein SEC24